MNKNFFLKLVSYVLSIFLLIVTVIYHICIYNNKTVSLYPSLVALPCFIYYLFLDHITNDNPEFYKCKRFMLKLLFLYSIFELIISILN